MAFVAALPEIADGAGAAGGATESGGMAGRLGGLFKPKPSSLPGEQSKQPNVGESRTQNFQDAANSVRSALRGGVD